MIHWIFIMFYDLGWENEDEDEAKDEDEDE